MVGLGREILRRGELRDDVHREWGPARRYAAVVTAAAVTEEKEGYCCDDGEAEDEAEDDADD